MGFHEIKMYPSEF